MSLGKAKLFSSGLLENDCLGTLRIPGVSRTLRVPSPDPPLPLGEVRTQGNRFWFESGDETVPPSVWATQNSEHEGQPKRHGSLQRAALNTLPPA